MYNKKHKFKINYICQFFSLFLNKNNVLVNKFTLQNHKIYKRIFLFFQQFETYV